MPNLPEQVGWTITGIEHAQPSGHEIVMPASLDLQHTKFAAGVVERDPLHGAGQNFQG